MRVTPRPSTVDATALRMLLTHQARRGGVRAIDGGPTTRGGGGRKGPRVDPEVRHAIICCMDRSRRLHGFAGAWRGSAGACGHHGRPSPTRMRPSVESSARCAGGNATSMPSSDQLAGLSSGAGAPDTAGCASRFVEQRPQQVFACRDRAVTVSVPLLAPNARRLAERSASSRSIRMRRQAARSARRFRSA